MKEETAPQPSIAPNLTSNKSRRRFNWSLVIAICLGLVCLVFWTYYYQSKHSSSKDTVAQHIDLIKNNSKATFREISNIGRPVALNLDKNGNLYVCDFGDNSVLVYNQQANLIKQIGQGKSADPGKFFMPHAVDFDPDSNIYITDYGNKRIQKFSAENNFISVLADDSSLTGPATAYFGTDNNLYASDYGANRVVRLSKDGQSLGWIGAKSDGALTNGWETTGESATSDMPGGFDRVHSTRQLDGFLYIVDTWNNRIQRFTTDGKFAGWIGAKEDNTLTNGWEMTGKAASSKQPGGFGAPIALDFINGNELAVLEYENPRIQRFSIDGKFLGWFGGTENGEATEGWQLEGESAMGSKSGFFNFAYDIHVRRNTIYVADTSNKRVQIIEFD